MKMPPNYWRKTKMGVPHLDEGSSSWTHSLAGLFVLRSLSTMNDGSKWLHVSVSRSDRLPSWEDVAKIKNEFIGEDEEAYHIIPKAKDHINIAQYCLHLWAPLDDEYSLPNLKELRLEEAI